VQATFDDNDHCVTPGWATRWAYPFHHVPFHRQIRCRLFGHRYPTDAPTPPNGHSPSNSARCPHCGTLIGFHVVGQHRYGSFNKDVFDAYMRRPV